MSTPSSDTLRDRLQNSLGTAYTLQRELGGGGMSRVFVAEEPRHGRFVVVKVLSPELAAGVSAERFAQEIRLAASLQQANIVPLLDSGTTADGLPYYTMPFVDGLSLRARLSRNGALPVAEAVSVLRDVTRALAYAHDTGVVHRDIKPENVLLSGDAAVVTDFGIAKALSASKTQAPGGTLTQVGTSLGTPAYMAPEQAAGDPATDHRADLYALGCLAYEMLVGSAPFAHRAPHQLFAAHLNESPTAVDKQRADVPRGLAALVARCMEKEPARRPQSAREVLQALDAATSGPAPVRARPRPVALGASIVALVAVAAVAWLVRGRADAPASDRLSAVAVLPFENASGDTASNYFADGMTDELATALAKMPGLQVASRTSSYAFRKRDGIDARTIASKLNVGAFVEGSVRRAGNQVRITAQLTRGDNGQSLWADAFTDDAGDVFAVQARLTRAIVAAITPALTGAQRPNDSSVVAAAPGTSDPVAFDLYLRARYELNRRGDGVRRSIPLFEQAVARDSTFASAWSGLAAAWAVLPDYEQHVPTSVALDSARRAARRAMTIDSTAWEGYASLGYALVVSGRFDEADPLLRRAVSLAPRQSVALRWLGILEDRMGRYAEAEREVRASLASDPLSAVSASNLAFYVAREPSRADEARAIARRAIALDPTNYLSVANSALALGMIGDTTAALDALRRGPPGIYSMEGVSLLRIRIFAARGQRDSIVALQRRVSALSPAARDFGVLATSYAALGDWPRAFVMADSAVSRTPTLDWIAQTAPVWSPMAHDPRLLAVCRRTRWNCDAVVANLAASPRAR